MIGLMTYLSKPRRQKRFFSDTENPVKIRLKSNILQQKIANSTNEI